jgi:hypothetical protein
MGGPGMPGQQEPQPIPQHANVWDVLTAILGHKPIEQEEELKKQKQGEEASPAEAGGPPGGADAGGPPGVPGMPQPTGGVPGSPHLMS